MDLNQNDSIAVCNYLSEWLPREIPISVSLGVVPIAWADKTLKLHVPLENNRNHMGTGFGGSLYTSALLVGWSWLHLQLKALGHDKDLHIVIQQANIQYPKPMNEDGIAICEGVDEKAWVKFEKMFNKFGKGRLQIETKVIVGDVVTTSFTGDFVAYMTERS